MSLCRLLQSHATLAVLFTIHEKTYQQGRRNLLLPLQKVTPDPQLRVC